MEAKKALIDVTVERLKAARKAGQWNTVAQLEQTLSHLNNRLHAVDNFGFVRGN